MGALRRQFGRRVRDLRKAQGLTQEGLARRAGMDYKYVGGVERGERNITLDNVERLVRALAVEPYEPFLFPLREARPAGEIDERVLANLLRHLDPAVRPLLVQLVHDVLRLVPAGKRRRATT
jgi:transcriptional regulator with XRE-family HTH domain